MYNLSAVVGSLVCTFFVMTLCKLSDPIQFETPFFKVVKVGW
jgi:hypothetical protein